MNRPRHNHQLGVNKIGKNIKKSPLNQPNLSTGIAPSRPQPRESLAERSIRPQHLPMLQQNILLKKTKPAALTQINRPHVPLPIMAQPTHDLAIRPPMHPLPHCSRPTIGNGDKHSSNTAASLDSVCMHYLQSSPGNSGHYGNHMQPSEEYQMQPQVQCQAHSHPILQSHSHHSHSSASSMPILPTPTAQHILQSSTTNRNLLFPRSPYQLSPGLQYPPPLTPRSFTSSSMAQPGILGPGTIPQPLQYPQLLTPRSFTSSSMAQPGILGPGTIPQPRASPRFVFPISGPRWRGY